MTRGKLIKVAVALAATGVAMYFVLSRITVDDVEDLRGNLAPGFLVLALGLYVLSNCMRALRYRVLLGNRIGTGRLLQVVFTQNFFNTFLPLRAGEVSYLYMVHSSGTVSPGANLASLLGARLLDFLFALLIPLAALPLSAAWHYEDPRIRTLVVVAVVIAAAIVAGTALGIWQSRRIAAFFQRRAARGEGRWHRGLRHVADMVDALGELRSGHRLIRVILLSAACWLLLFLTGAIILMGIGLPISLADAVFVSGFPTLASMTPVYMFGGFGLYEGTVAFGLSLLGVPTEQAVAGSLLAHVAELSLIVLCALPVPLIALSSAKRG